MKAFKFEAAQEHILGLISELSDNMSWYAFSQYFSSHRISQRKDDDFLLNDELYPDLTSALKIEEEFFDYQIKRSKIFLPLM